MGVAGAISCHGNPPSAPACHGGGARYAEDRGEEGGDGSRLNQNSSEQTDNFINRYKRHTIKDARDWQQSRKQKRDRDNNEDAYSTPPQTFDPTVISIEAAEAQKSYDRWHVPRVGEMCTSRPQGIYRLMGGQINSASSTASRDRKVADINRLIDEWDIQGGCLQEMGINWSAQDYEQNLTSWFRFDRREIRTFTSHNDVHENIEQSQQGGVAQFLCKDLCAYASETEPDFRGLGQW